MYKVIASFWSKPTSSNKAQLSSNPLNDEDNWVFVSDNVVVSSSVNTMTNSWIASPPLIKTDETSENVHHFNPIENLLIEHASMSVYEQIASKTRNKRQRKILDDNKLDEQAEEEINDDDDDDRASVILQHANSTSGHPRSFNSSTTTLESSTSSLVAHHRHLHRRHQRRKRSTKLLLTTSIDESKQIFNKSIERQRLNHTRTPKVLLHQAPRSKH